MGSEQSHARGTSVPIDAMEPVQYNENELSVTFFTYTETFK